MLRQTIFSVMTTKSVLCHRLLKNENAIAQNAGGHLYICASAIKNKAGRCVRFCTHLPAFIMPFSIKLFCINCINCIICTIILRYCTLVYGASHTLCIVKIFHPVHVGVLIENPGNASVEHGAQRNIGISPLSVGARLINVIKGQFNPFSARPEANFILAL